MFYSQGVGHSGEITRVKIAPNGKHMVSVSADGAIVRWKMPKMATRQDEEQPLNTSATEQLAASSNGGERREEEEQIREHMGQDESGEGRSLMEQTEQLTVSTEEGGVNSQQMNGGDNETQE